jgi:hypothetical protein
MKNPRSWPCADQAEWEGDCRPNALIRPLVVECPVFEFRMTLCIGRVQTVYDLAEKHDSSLDLIGKNPCENDLVYDLTEIDTCCRSGKRMPRRTTTIVVRFETPPLSLFATNEADLISPNYLI